MADELVNEVLRKAVAKICLAIGFDTTQPLVLYTLADILKQRLKYLSKLCVNFSEYEDFSEPNSSTFEMVLKKAEIGLPELTNYIHNFEYDNVEELPKFPLPSNHSINFLKPGSDEALNRPSHIPEYLPSMIINGTNDLNNINEDSHLALVKKSTSDENGAMNNGQLKSSFKSQLLTSDINKRGPIRDIKSAYMTASGYLSASIVAKTPVPMTNRVIHGLDQINKKLQIEEEIIDLTCDTNDTNNSKICDDKSYNIKKRLRIEKTPTKVGTDRIDKEKLKVFKKLTKIKTKEKNSQMSPSSLPIEITLDSTPNLNSNKKSEKKRGRPRLHFDTPPPTQQSLRSQSNSSPSSPQSLSVMTTSPSAITDTSILSIFPSPSTTDTSILSTTPPHSLTPVTSTSCIETENLTITTSTTTTKITTDTTSLNSILGPVSSLVNDEFEMRDTSVKQKIKDNSKSLAVQDSNESHVKISTTNNIQNMTNEFLNSNLNSPVNRTRLENYANIHLASSSPFDTSNCDLKSNTMLPPLPLKPSNDENMKQFYNMQLNSNFPQDFSVPPTLLPRQTRLSICDNYPYSSQNPAMPSSSFSNDIQTPRNINFFNTIRPLTTTQTYGAPYVHGSRSTDSFNFNNQMITSQEKSQFPQNENQHQHQQFLHSQVQTQSANIPSQNYNQIEPQSSEIQSKFVQQQSQEPMQTQYDRTAQIDDESEHQQQQQQPQQLQQQQQQHILQNNDLQIIPIDERNEMVNANGLEAPNVNLNAKLEKAKRKREKREKKEKRDKKYKKKETKKAKMIVVNNADSIQCTINSSAPVEDVVPKLTLKLPPMNNFNFKKGTKNIECKSSKKKEVHPPIENVFSGESKISLAQDTPLLNDEDYINNNDETAEDTRFWKCPVCLHYYENEDAMICCDKCNYWYHWKCVGLIAAPNIDKWYCSRCEIEMHNTNNMVKRSKRRIKA